MLEENLEDVGDGYIINYSAILDIWHNFGTHNAKKKFRNDPKVLVKL